MESLPISETTLGAFLTVILFAIVFLVSRYLRDWLSPFSVDQQLTQEDNNALSISIAGYFIGITAIFLGAEGGPSHGLVKDLTLVASYSFAGMIMLNISRWVNDKLILHKFSNVQQIIEHRNMAAGLVQAASYIASGLVVSGAIHGEEGGPHHAFIFFLIGQVVLVLFSRLYVTMTRYALHEELEKGNLAVGFSFSGALISIGLITMKAVSGAFTGWWDTLLLLVIDLTIIIIYLIGIRFFFDKMIIPGSQLNKELVVDQNVGAGALEMFAAVCFSMVLVTLL